MVVAYVIAKRHNYPTVAKAKRRSQQGSARSGSQCIVNCIIGGILTVIYSD